LSALEEARQKTSSVSLPKTECALTIRDGCVLLLMEIIWPEIRNGYVSNRSLTSRARREAGQKGSTPKDDATVSVSTPSSDDFSAAWSPP
jgi:hypothetical protein